MKIICKTTLLPSEPPFVGTRIALEIPAGQLDWKIRELDFAEGHDHAVVSWGDGCVERREEALGTIHTYPAPGRYEVRISDDLRGLCLSYRLRTFYDAYARQIRGFSSDAKNLRILLADCFRECVNLESFDAGGAAIGTLGKTAFKNCTGLRGAIALPDVSALEGSAASDAPFAGCAGLEEIRFAAEHEAAIRDSEIFRADPTLGAANATVRFVPRLPARGE